MTYNKTSARLRRCDPLEEIAEEQKGEAIRRFTLANMELGRCAGCGQTHLMPVSHIT